MKIQSRYAWWLDMMTRSDGKARYVVFRSLAGSDRTSISSSGKESSDVSVIVVGANTEIKTITASRQPR